MQKQKLTISALLFLLAVPFCAQAQTPYSYDLNYLAQSAGHYHRVDPLLIRAVIHVESRGQHTRKDGTLTLSPVGAAGLMQLMPRTAWGLRVDPADPWANVYGGAMYLRQMLDRYNNNLPLALAAYNAGPGRVKDRVPDIPETKYYVEAVLYYYEWFRSTTPAQTQQRAKPAAVVANSADPVFWVDQY